MFSKKAMATLACAGALALVSAGVAAAEERSVGENVDDTTLGVSIKYHLIEKPGVPAGRINVETYKGDVVLAGFVPSSEEHKAALEAAAEVEGVDKVVDAMIVMPGSRTFGQTIDDQTITTKLNVKIRAEDAFSKVTVQVRNGEVLLGGFAEDKAMMAQAEAFAREISGVTKVHNRVQLET